MLFRRISRWLEELDQIPGGIFQQDLPTARSLDEVVAELDSGLPEQLDFRLEPAAPDDQPIPATRFRPAAVRHGLGATPRALGGTQHELKILPLENCKVGARLSRETEAQMPGVEADRGIDIANNVSNHECVQLHQ